MTPQMMSARPDPGVDGYHRTVSSVQHDIFGRCSLFLFMVLSAFAQAQQNTPTKVNNSRYTIVHTVMADRVEFISVVVRPSISDPELMTLAIELHKLHPRSNISFYDRMDTARIKQWWNC